MIEFFGLLTLSRSDSFDKAAGLTCCRRKCHLVTTQPQCPWRYEVTPALKFLGIELCLDSGQAVPLKLNLEKLITRAISARLQPNF